MTTLAIIKLMCSMKVFQGSFNMEESLVYQLHVH